MPNAAALDKTAEAGAFRRLRLGRPPPTLRRAREEF